MEKNSVVLVFCGWRGRQDDTLALILWLLATSATLFVSCVLCCSTNQKLNRSELVTPSSVYENLYILADLAQPIINLEDHARESVSSLSAYGRKQKVKWQKKQSSVPYCSYPWLVYCIFLAEKRFLKHEWKIINISSKFPGLFVCKGTH